MGVRSAGASFQSAALAGNVAIGGTLAVAGASTLASLSVTGASTLTGDIAAGNIAMATGKRIGIDPGSVASPGLYVIGSSGTGAYSAGADQFQIGRAGAAAMGVTSGGVGISVALTTTGSHLIQGPTRPSSHVTQTADYTLLTSGGQPLIMNVAAGGTLTVPQTPLSGQLWFPCLNLSANPLTIARHASTPAALFNNVDANVTIAAGALFFIFWNHVHSTYLIGEIGPA